MKPIRLALFVVLFIFHLIVVFLSLRFTQSLADSIVRDPSAFRFLALFGLAVFLVTFAFGWFDRWTARRKIEQLEAEKDRIKAEVFDREQRARERELEIEQEINSFQQSLPKADPPAAPMADDDDDYAPMPDPTRPPLDAPSETWVEPAETDQVEYAPLKPKYPDTPSDDDNPADESQTGQSSTDDAASDREDTDPYRS